MSVNTTNLTHTRVAFGNVSLLLVIMSTDCPSCCADCSVRNLTLCSSDSPYALRNLLQAGTITLAVSGPLVCDHGSHAEDGWHHFDESEIISHLSEPQCAVFCRELDFLINHSFISVTYRRANDGWIVLRIYLIPYDLPNVQGKLRVRKSIVLNPAKRYMRSLLARIVQDQSGWLGLSPRDGNDLIPEIIV